MHPAASILVFTTLSGAGYGLLAILAAGAASGLLPAERWLGGIGLGLGLLLVTVGLGASTLHLGHPERAWRAVSQWRSSWLSREGVAALATFLPILVLAIGWVGFGRILHLAAAGTAIGAAVTIFCTAQIYATLQPIARWRHPLTTPCYLALGLATGALGAMAVTRLAGAAWLWLDVVALVALPLAWVLKLAWWRGTDRAPPLATTAEATSLQSSGRVRLLDPPHTGRNYLLNEMGFKIARKHARKLRRLSLLGGLAVPWLAGAGALAAGSGALGTGLASVAFLTSLAGTLIERWLFFAEAEHTVMLYYRTAAA